MLFLRHRCASCSSTSWSCGHTGHVRRNAVPALFPSAQDLSSPTHWLLVEGPLRCVTTSKNVLVPGLSPAAGTPYALPEGATRSPLGHKVTPPQKHPPGKSALFPLVSALITLSKGYAMSLIVCGPLERGNEPSKVGLVKGGPLNSPKVIIH